MLWFALALFTFLQVQAVTCEFHGLQECEFTSTEKKSKWHSEDKRVLENVFIRSRTNLLEARVHRARIPAGKFKQYHQDCFYYIMKPETGGCERIEQVVPYDKMNQSWRDGGCSLFHKHWEGAWCTKFNASLQGAFGDKNFIFTSIKIFWSKTATPFEIENKEPGVELSWRLPVSVPLYEADSDEADSDAGFQVLFYSLKNGFAQKNEMFFTLHEEVVYPPVAYFLSNIGLGHLNLARPKIEYELHLDQSFTRPAGQAKDRFAGEFYLRASQMMTTVTKIPTLNIGALPYHVGGFAQFLIAVGTVSFLGCRKTEVCLDDQLYHRVRRAKEVSIDELNIVKKELDDTNSDVSSAAD